MKAHAASAPSVRDQATSAAQDLAPSASTTGSQTTSTTYGSTNGSTAVYDQNVDDIDGTGPGTAPRQY
jgi:hypothetical protein